MYPAAWWRSLIAHFLWNLGWRWPTWKHSESAMYPAAWWSSPASCYPQRQTPPWTHLQGFASVDIKVPKSETIPPCRPQRRTPWFTSPPGRSYSRHCAPAGKRYYVMIRKAVSNRRKCASGKILTASYWPDRWITMKSCRLDITNHISCWQDCMNVTWTLHERYMNATHERCKSGFMRARPHESD